MLGKNSADPLVCALYGFMLTLVGIAYNFLWFYLEKTQIRQENVLKRTVLNRA